MNAHDIIGCTPSQQKLRECTCALPGPRRCPHPPHRRHPGQRGLMACQPFPRQQTWLQRASRQLQGQGGRELKNTKVPLSLHVAYGVCNEVRCRLYPTSLLSPIHHCLTPTPHVETTLVVVPNATSLHWAYGPPYSLTAEGDRSLMWPYHITGTPGCSTPKVDNQHSPGVTTAVAPRAVPASTNEVFPASPT